MLFVGGILDISKQVEKVFSVWICLEIFLKQDLGDGDAALRPPQFWKERGMTAVCPTEVAG